MIELMKALFIVDDETIIPPEVYGHRINIEVLFNVIKMFNTFSTSINHLNNQTKTITLKTHIVTLVNQLPKDVIGKFLDLLFGFS